MGLLVIFVSLLATVVSLTLHSVYQLETLKKSAFEVNCFKHVQKKMYVFYGVLHTHACTHTHAHTPEFNKSISGTGVIKASFMKANALWPTPFLNAAILPWTLGETHSTPSHRSVNNGDICERCFPKINVLKNVFPLSLAFHITSAAHLLRALSEQTKLEQQNRLEWGSTCTVGNEKTVWSDSLVTRRQPCQHPMQLAEDSQGPHWESEARWADSVRYLILCSLSKSVKVNHKLNPCRQLCGSICRPAFARHSVSYVARAENAADNIFQNIFPM